MDDIQFWLYLLFGAIYLISRALKKKKPERPPVVNRPSRGSEKKPQKAVTFEELLKEFTEGREEAEEQPVYQQEEEQPIYKPDKSSEESAPVFEEGRDRRFSDEESKRVYEESIALAEGTEIPFERNVHFKSKLKSASEKEEETLASDIIKTLSNSDDARKAVVLSEILNRRY